MKSVWNVPGNASALHPQSFTSSEPSLPLPIPPDPPDPTSPLSPHLFPPLLSSNPTGLKPFSSKKKGFKSSKNSTTAVTTQSRNAISEGKSLLGVPENQTTAALDSKPISPNHQKTRSTVQTTVTTFSPDVNHQPFTTIPLKSSSPLNTNPSSASTSSNPPQSSSSNITLPSDQIPSPTIPRLLP